MYEKRKIREACKLAIENVYKESISDVEIFKRPFEINFLKEEDVKKKLIDKIEKALITRKFEELKVNKIGHVLVPKKNLSDFRKCALIDIVDEVLYLTMVILMAPSIEKERLKKSDNIIFSYRYKTNDGDLFDTNYNFTSFRNHVAKNSKMDKYQVIVECDISNYYDRLNIHRVESVLLSIKSINKDLVKLLNELLLFWANRDSYGLPIGSNASRILAEAALIEVDNYLISQNVDFCRFVDDYRIFAKDAATAHKHLSLLVTALSREGLFLNTNKTKIKDISNCILKQQENSEIVEEKNTNKLLELDEKRNSLPKIIRGYSGIIPTKFRNLTTNEEESLKLEDEKEIVKSLNKSVLIEPSEFIKLIKLLVAKEEYDSFSYIPDILEKFPQFIPYFTDVVLKKQDKLSDEIIKKLKAKFKLLFEEKNVPEYILIYLIRVLSKGKLSDKVILLEYFRSLKRVSGDYIGRALLESFEGKLSRGEILEIRQYYIRADNWEKRQIIKLIQDNLANGEKRAFFKDVKIHNNDFWIEFITSDKEKFKQIMSK